MNWVFNSDSLLIGTRIAPRKSFSNTLAVTLSAFYLSRKVGCLKVSAVTCVVLKEACELLLKLEISGALTLRF